MHDFGNEVHIAGVTESEIRVSVDVGDVKGGNKHAVANCVAPSGKGLVVVFNDPSGEFPSQVAPSPQKVHRLLRAPAAVFVFGEPRPVALDPVGY